MRGAPSFPESGESGSLLWPADLAQHSSCEGALWADPRAVELCSPVLFSEMSVCQWFLCEGFSRRGLE